MRKGGRPARIQPFCSESQENQSPTQKEQAGEWGHALGLSGGTIHHTADASLFLWSARKKAPHRKKNLLHITKKAGSEPQGLSGRLRRAGVSVMGSFLDQTARATEDRKWQIPRIHANQWANIQSTPSQGFVGTPCGGLPPR